MVEVTSTSYQRYKDNAADGATSTMGAQRRTHHPVHTTAITKQTASADPGLKSTDPYANDNRAEAFAEIHEGKVDEGNGENSSCRDG